MGGRDSAIRGERPCRGGVESAAAKVLTQQAFQRLVYVKESVVKSVGQPGGLRGQVGVVAGQDAEFDSGLLIRTDPAKGVGKGAGRVGDDVSVTGVGLGFPGVEIRDPSHRQSRQMGHGNAPCARDGDHQSPDRGELVDDDEHSSVTFQLLKEAR